jgi:hypothetical protein
MATLYNLSWVGIIERSGVGKDAIDKTVDALRVRYNAQPLQGQMFVRKETARGGTYKESSFGTSLELMKVNEDTDQLPYAVPVPGFKGSATVVTRRLALRVERAYMEDDLKGIVSRQASGLLGAARMTYEYAIADRINNVTSSASPYAGADGAALAADTHTQELATTTAWDNLQTASALSLTTLSTARASLRKRTNEFGYPNPLKFRYLVVPPDLEGKARELKVVGKDPDTSTNRPNVWAADPWEVFVYDYMTDTNAWFLMADIPEENKGIVIAESAAPSVMSFQEPGNPDVLNSQRVRCRFAVLNMDGKWLEYNAGA